VYIQYVIPKITASVGAHKKSIP